MTHEHPETGSYAKHLLPVPLRMLLLYMIKSIEKKNRLSCESPLNLAPGSLQIKSTQSETSCHLSSSESADFSVFLYAVVSVVLMMLHNYFLSNCPPESTEGLFLNLVRFSLSCFSNIFEPSSCLKLRS